MKSIALLNTSSTASGGAAQDSSFMSSASQWVSDNLFIILAVVLVILLLLLLIPLFKRMRQKKVGKERSKELSDDLLLRQQLAELARGGKEGEAAEKKLLAADIHEMRGILETGSKHFDSKSLYTNPWYMLIGEPGSGKTEMMRQSHLNFPVHTTDTEQGRGGTKSLHWWISNEGTILDIAGSVLFNSWGSKGNTKWRYLLSRLHKIRKKCPVNGIIVTIPVDSLLADSEKLILKKARVLSEELHVTLKMLNLSVPVYIVITKMDMLSGFTHFFSNVKDEGRFQPFGFTTDKPYFDKDEIDSNFVDLKEVLKQKRELQFASADLWEQAHDPELYGDSVESLYNLPETFGQLDVPLKNYLRTIFSGSKLISMANVDLRGVFFTSALEGGSIIDLALPKLTDTNIDECEYTYSEQSTETGYFIRDLLTNKIFKEGGLVHYSKIAMAKRRRVPLIAAVALFTVSISSIFFTQSQSGKLKGNAEYAQTEQKEMTETLSLGWKKIRRYYIDGELENSPYYLILNKEKAVRDPLKPDTSTSQPTIEAKSLPFADLTISRSQFLALAEEQANDYIEVPFRFRMLSFVRDYSWDDMLQNNRHDAFNKIYATMVAKPLVDYTRQGLEWNHAAQWTEKDTNIIKELLQIELSEGEYLPNLTLFFDYVLKQDFGRIDYISNRNSFIEKYNEFKESTVDLAPIFVADPTMKAFFQHNLSTTIKTFCQQSESLISFPGLDLHALTELTKLTNEIKALRATILGHTKYIEVDREQTLTKAAENKKKLKVSIEKQIANLEKFIELKHKLGITQKITPKQLINSSKEQALSLVTKNYQKLLSLFEDYDVPESDSEILAPLKMTLEESYARFKHNQNQRAESLTATLKSNSELLWYFDSNEQLQDDADQLIRLYKTALASFSTPIKFAKVFNYSAKIEQLHSSYQKLRSSITQQEENIGFTERQHQPLTISKNVIAFSERLAESRSIDDLLSHSPQDREEIEDLIAEIPSKSIILPVYNISLGANEGNEIMKKSFSPESAKTFCATWAEFGNAIKTEATLKKLYRHIPYDINSFRSRYYSLNDEVMKYESKYIQYWSQYVPSLATVPRFADWNSLYDKIKDQRAYLINQDLLSLYKMTKESLENFPIQNRSLAALIKSYLIKIDTRIEGITDTFNKTSESCLASWSSLPLTADGVSNKFIQLSDNQLKTSYFIVYNAKDRQHWWSQFIEVAVECINKDVKNQLKNTVVMLTNSYMKFPFCNVADRKTLLTPEQVDSGTSNIAKLIAGFNPNKKTAPQSKFDYLVRKVKPHYAFSTEKQQNWAKQLYNISELLNSNNKQIQWTLAVYGAEMQEKIPDLRENKKVYSPTAAYRRMRYMEVYINGEMLGQRISTISPDGIYQIKEAMSGNIGQRDMKICFYMSGDDTEPKATIAFDGSWAPLNLYVQKGAIYDNDKSTFLIPLLFKDEAGYECYYWIGMKFDRNPPPYSQWPTRDTWVSYDNLFNTGG